MNHSQKVYKLNLPPETSIRVPHGELRAFVSKAAQKVGMPEDKADLLAELLTANDLRGVHSHGTRQMARYAISLRDGLLNNTPRVRVVRETPVSLVVDGDGGLGYFPAYEGTLRAIEKAKSQGIAVMQTRNHGHFGAAGIYARMPLEHDLLTFMTGGLERMELEPGMPVYSSAVGSPMSFSAPAREHGPLVVDFSPVYDLRTSPRRGDIEEWVPGTIFRCIGLGNIAQAWGGMLAAVRPEEPGATRQYREADQAGLLITFQIGLFVDPAEFRHKLDGFAQGIGGLAPLPGFERAQLPGEPEAARERAYRVEGIPVGPGHQRELERMADELSLAVPWG